MNEKSQHAAAGLIINRLVRCFIQALFTAGVLVPFVNLLNLVEPARQPYLFFLVLGIAFVGGLLQERIRRFS